HPRLARALLDGAAEVGARNAAEVVALLDAGGTLTDVEAELRRLRSAGDDGSRRWKQDARRLESLLTDRKSVKAPFTGENAGKEAFTADPALVVALAHPERLAKRRPGGAPVYLMAGGTAAELPPGSGLDAEWLAVAEATRDPGRVHGTIRLAAAADERLAVRAGSVSEVDEVTWDGDVVARRVRKLGAIVLSEKPLKDADVHDALVAGLRAEGLGLLKWRPDATRLRERLAFLHEVLGPPWPAVDDAALLSDVDSWLDLSGARRKADLAAIDAGTALKALLPWPEAAKLDELAPDRLEVPSGSRIRVDYRGDRPVLAVKLQETFGWTETPTLAGVPVVLHLLSPAGRPAAITADLAGFWTTGYPAVRADLRGRYPKHPWPEDPATAVPTRHTSRRR
ncbi:ATP-dependent helicase C-terminal domain-containing protein, partial [Amycolatopsis sp. SID8362]|uniref:ATP-dependent helicase C-terminal domain-containing protein n=1 Tax=Amycolatopsis sp. SID8362 TaxID=2690346 RepID=UPI00142AC919